MKIEDNEKVSILLVALTERYSSLHKIRERVQNIGIWALGLMIGASGWFIQSDIVLSKIQALVIIFGVLASVYVLKFIYLHDLQQGFRGQLRTLSKLEKTLGFFTPSFFSDEVDSIYPKSWEIAGTEGGDGKFFESTYSLLFIGTIFLVLSVLLNAQFFSFITACYFKA